MQTLTALSSNGNSTLSDIRRISIASDFSDTPIGRYRIDGKESGETFREDIIAPALKQGEVILDLDGLFGLPSSFWEEVMGGLVRHHFSLELLRDRLTIVCTEDALKVFVRTGWRFAEDAWNKKNVH